MSRSPTKSIKSAKKAHAAPAPAESSVTAWLIPLALVVITLLVLWPVCTADFTSWDDTANVAKNPMLNPVTVEGVLYFWAHPHMAIYIPLTYTVWGALAAVAKVDPVNGIALNPYVFHTANLLAHLLAVLVAYRLLLLLSRNKWAAGAGALVFAIHPVQVESVAWVAGMKDVLAGLFSLIAIWQYVEFAKTEPNQERRAAHYGVATVAFVLALLAKPSAMTVPLVVALIDAVLLRRPWKEIALAAGPWLLPALVCAIVARIAQPVSAIAPPDGGHVLMRPLLAGDALAFYLGHILWPARLAVQYHHAPRVELAGRWIYFAWLIPAGAIVAAWLLRKRWPWVIVALGLLIAATLPVLGLVPFQFERFSLVADHYLYVAMLGPALAVCCLFAASAGSRILWVIFSIAAIAMGVQSFIQTGAWRDTASLFQHTLAANPDSDVACNALANLAFVDTRLTPDQQLAQAESWARRAIELDPTHEDPYITLAAVLSRKHQLPEAIAMYRRAVQLNPRNAVALNDLAHALAEQAQQTHGSGLEEAEDLCRRSLALDPSSASAHANLSVILGTQNRLADALAEAEEAVRLDPFDAGRQTNLAVFLMVNGHRAEALTHLEQALSLDPNYLKAQQLQAALSGPRR
jgi:tetratricopeptide (TPR) repeat protein